MPPILLLRECGDEMHDNFFLILLNDILRIISIFHFADISCIFLYLIFRPIAFIDAIKTVTLFITSTHL